jgi:hypothetical protein
MTNFSYFNKWYLVILIIIIAVLAVIQYYYYENKVNLVLAEEKINKYKELEKEEKPIKIINLSNESSSNQSTDIISDYDYRIISDPLKEPGKRPPRHVIGPMINSPHFNIPTRGYPDSFNVQGYLIDDASTDNKDSNKMLRLYGRQVYPNSNEWEYYVEVNVGHHDKFKFDLEKQKREIFDGDKVYVDILKRNYDVKLLKQKGLEYNPFLW